MLVGGAWRELQSRAAGAHQPGREVGQARRQQLATARIRAAGRTAAAWTGSAQRRAAGLLHPARRLAGVRQRASWGLGARREAEQAQGLDTRVTSTELAACCIVCT